ncbi:MAG: hypothetical protein JOZ78_14300 [Chroococcidiopsidaceae cyanobacterium CP_BM_ER_R8_30]|nr:hypothetical protein [Chroococcidiopsidaceae cyanobacterium CP_BM_ER_R8_30]
MTAPARDLSLTDSQWYGLQRIAAQREISLTELLDKLSSGELIVADPEKLEDRLDLLDALETLAEMKASDEKPVSWKQVASELGH